MYWEKINADRMARYNAKREKKRGSDKVKKVEWKCLSFRTSYISVLYEIEKLKLLSLKRSNNR